MQLYILLYYFLFPLPKTLVIAYLYFFNELRLFVLNFPKQ